jgi:transmembrane sensor
MPVEYEYLILKSLSGTASPEEEDVLTAWRKESLFNEQSYQDLRKVFDLRDPTHYPSFDTEQEWLKLEASMNGHRKKEVHRTIPLWLKAAASLLLLVACTFLIREMTRERLVEHVASGEIESIRLHDGTTVWLKPDSRLVHTSSFNDQTREVTLEGAAYFDVHRDPEKPFVIKTEKSTIKVLGTAFMVYADHSDSTVEVEVTEGLVAFAHNDALQEEVKLAAGTKAVLNRHSKRIDVREFATDNVLSWKTKQLVFKKTRLTDVVDAIESYFGVQVTSANPDLLQCRFTGTFPDPQIEEVLEALSVSLNINVIHQDGRYLLQGEGCQ